MKILLVIPISSYPTQHPSFLSNTDFPVGFAYIAGALKQAGHRVAGLNPNNDTDTGSARELLEKRLIQAIITENPHMIGLGGLSTDVHFINDAITLIRAFRPHIPIICGGGIITNDADFIFRMLKPDFCIIGDGETVVVRLAEAIEKGGISFQEIPNIGYWDNSIPVFTERRPDETDINTYAYPDYEPFGIDKMLSDHALVTRYQYRYTRSRPIPMTLVAARGCPFSCSFCVHHDGRRYRYRSIEGIMDEIKVLHERYRFNVLIILDELFAVHSDRLLKFSQAVMEGRRTHGWDFDWCFQTHASANLDKDTLLLAKEAGCFFFSYGIESASPVVLANMNKRSNPEQIAEAIRLSEEVKIGFGGNFIFGDPAETFETAQESVRFYKEYCRNSHINVGIVQPYPGSKLFDYCIEKNIIPDRLGYYQVIDQLVFNMTALSNEEWQHLVGYIIAEINGTQLSSTAPLVTRQDPYASEGEKTRNGVRKPWEMWMKCPHCQSAVYTRELLDAADVAEGRASFKTACPTCHKRFVVNIRASL